MKYNKRKCLDYILPRLCRKFVIFLNARADIHKQTNSRYRNLTISHIYTIYRYTAPLRVNIHISKMCGRLRAAEHARKLLVSFFKIIIFQTK